MDHYKFSTLEYKRPDGEARRAQLIKWKEAVEHAENYDALRKLMLENDLRLGIRRVKRIVLGDVL